MNKGVMLNKLKDVKNALIIVVGVPGSGKSTISKEIANINNNVKIVSSDAMRKELFGSEDTQENPKLVFGKLNERTAEYLEKGYSVIYDATNIHSKGRKATLENFKDKYSTAIAIYVDTDIKEAKLRNSKRERVVPEEVIDRMYSKLKTPSKDEGFDIVYILN